MGAKIEAEEKKGWDLKKAKAVPLHTIKAHGGRGAIPPTHSRPQQYMGASGQRHAPAAL
jgi:hypothetical protein